MTTDRCKLIASISLEESRLAELDIKRQEILDHINDLRQQLSAIDAVTSPAQETSTLSSKAKIDLFRALFKGREDVYPKLWISKNGSVIPSNAANSGIVIELFSRQAPRIFPDALPTFPMRLSIH